MRILILNWRCIKNPKAGGAELVTQRIAERLVQWGHSVTWFTAGFDGGLAVEEINGVKVLRDGNQKTVHFKAFQWYRRFGRGKFDVVVDEINTVPFLTPLYSDVPVVAFFHQLAREVWFYESLFPVNVAGFVLEPYYLIPYRRLPIVTVSTSSATSLRGIGFQGNICIIPEAVDWDSVSALPPLSTKERELTLICLGRVVSSKRVEHAIRALKHVHESGVCAFLWIVGDGEARYFKRLEREVAHLRLSRFVRFMGRVGDHEKRQLLSRAHILVACSVREGWGLMVTEANLAGTPSVTYDVPGLRDSTKHMETGLVCTQNTPEHLAKHILRLLPEADLYASVRRSAWKHARSLSWEKTARGFEMALNRALHGPDVRVHAMPKKRRHGGAYVGQHDDS